MLCPQLSIPLKYIATQFLIVQQMKELLNGLQLLLIKLANNSLPVHVY